MTGSWWCLVSPGLSIDAIVWRVCFLRRFIEQRYPVVLRSCLALPALQCFTEDKLVYGQNVLVVFGRQRVLVVFGCQRVQAILDPR